MHFNDSLGFASNNCLWYSRITLAVVAALIHLPTEQAPKQRPALAS